MTREIALSNGEVTLVDAADFEWLSHWRWYYAKPSNGKTAYARRNIKKENKRRSGVGIHRVILGVVDNPLMQVDHINGNGLDNRRENLRLCTKSQNQHNKGLNINNTSGCKGVTWDKYRNKWKVQINKHGKKIMLGRTDNLLAAAEIYKKAAIELHEQFAKS